MAGKVFSRQLNEWLDSGSPKTLQGLVDHFAEKSFAILFVVLMAIPALAIGLAGVALVISLRKLLFDEIWRLF